MVDWFSATLDFFINKEPLFSSISAVIIIIGILILIVKLSFLAILRFASLLFSLIPFIWANRLSIFFFNIVITFEKAAKYVKKI